MDGSDNGAEPANGRADPQEPPRTGEASRWDTLRAQAGRAEETIRTIARRLQATTGSPKRGGPAELALTLSLSASDGRPPLFEQIVATLREHAARADAFCPGRVYCYWCDSAECEHSLPPGPRSVFAGYAAAGQPTWHDLVQPLLNAGDPRVDRIFARPPRPVALYQPGRELKQELLHAFGRASKTYDILGQVVAGYFPVAKPAGARESAGAAAVTFQVVESRGAAGKVQLNLNIVAYPGCGPEQIRDPAVGAARGFAEARLARFEDALRRDGSTEARGRTLGKVPTLLRRLAGIVDRSVRQSMRRTRHRDQRGETRSQTHKAMDDLKGAGVDRVFYDERRATLIVLGDRHRVHAFSQDGRHVTTFTMDRESVERRLRVKRWRCATETEVAALRSAVEAGPDADAPADV